MRPVAVIVTMIVPMVIPVIVATVPVIIVDDPALHRFMLTKVPMEVRFLDANFMVRKPPDPLMANTFHIEPSVIHTISIHHHAMPKDKAR